MRSGISGYGLISAVGNGVEETRKRLWADFPVLPARSRRVASSLDLPVFELALPDYDAETPGGVTMHLLRRALTEALDAAGLDRRTLAERRVAVCIGTTVACQLNNLPFYAGFRRGEPELNSGAIRHYIDGCPAEWIRREYSLSGPALTISNACASGADAIGVGMLYLERGLCDICVCGGADEVNKVPLDGFNALRVCSSAPCRPFDRDRSGLNLGDGAAAVILETTESAARRGKRMEFFASGFGKTADAFHITQPEPSGAQLEQAVLIALEQAGCTPGEIAFVNAHGTGTAVNDAVEAPSLARVFGSQLHYMSTKSLTGHTLGAAGTLEFVLSLLMLERGLAAGSHRCEHPDPAIPVPPLARNLPVGGRFALSTSLAFGGSNTALVLERR